MDKMAVKWDINFGTLIPILLALAGGALWVNSELTELRVRVLQNEELRTQRTSETDQKFADLTTAVKLNEATQNKLAQIIDNLS